MRSYALFLVLAVLHARAATIPAPENEKKLPIVGDALDDVSFDNNESEQELVDTTNTVKEIENNLRKSIPENVPVKIIEEQPVIKTIAIKEDSNDYVPDNDDSANIKRVEIDLKNPGPPQRQEHDSQKPVTYVVDNERAVAAIKQSIAESQDIFTRGIQDVSQRFKYYFENNDQLAEVSSNIQKLKKNFEEEVVKLSKTINSYLKPGGVEVIEGSEDVGKSSGIKEVENRLKTLKTNFNTGVNMLSEGVELLSILAEEDEQNLKMSGKADNGNVGTETGTSTGTAPAIPAPGSGTTTSTVSNPVFDFVQNLNQSIVNAFNGLSTTIQNFLYNGQNGQQASSANSTSQGGFNPISLFQGINIPNIFQQNTNQKPENQQGAAPAGSQSDDASTTQRPNFFQQIQSTLQNIVSPGQTNQPETQQNQNPITQFFTGVNQGISNLFQGRPPQQTTQQTNQPNAVVGQAAPQPAAAAPQPAAAASSAAQGTNSVPVTSAQIEPANPERKESVTVDSTPEQSKQVPGGPIQQIVQNNPVVKGAADAVKKIQGLSNPSKQRDNIVDQKTDTKGHGSYSSVNTGDTNNSGVDSAPIVVPAKEQPAAIPEIQDNGQPEAELKKTE